MSSTPDRSHPAAEESSAGSASAAPTAEQPDQEELTQELHYPRQAVHAALLSKLAGLQGQAVPAFRFGMLERGQGGAELSALRADQQLQEMWQARFPVSVARFLKNGTLHQRDFPLLWISDDESDVRVLRGQTSQGNFVSEDDGGVTMELLKEQASKGLILSLTVREPGVSAQEQGQRSASQWFTYAMLKHKRVFLEAIFATFVISTLGLFSSLYSMQVYDRVIPTKGFSTLFVLTFGVLMAIALDVLMKHVRAHMVDRASKVIDLELSGVFFSKALSIRMDARPTTVGTFASQIRNFESVRTFLTSSTLFVLADAPFALFFIAVIGAIAGPVAFLPLVMVPLSLIVGFILTRPVERLAAETMQESNTKNGLLIESVDGIESIKAAGGEWKMLDRYRALSDAMASTELKQRMQTTRTTSATQVLQQLNYVLLTAIGAYAISSGSLTMGGLIACSIISGRALGPLGQIPGMVAQWKGAKVALQGLDAIMAMPSDREDGVRLVVPESCDGRVRLQGASFAYGQDKPILEVDSLAIQPGERIAVVGAVGSGKTTLIKLLSGLYKPTAGSVYLDDVDINQLAPEFIREHVGYLTQDVRLFAGTLRENLTLGLPTPSDSVILRAAKHTGLAQAIQNHPRGLELMISEGGRGLSGGQRQLVGLTRMLLAKPRLMLLDEPTASLDAQLENHVMKHLFQEIDPRSVLIVVTHKLGVLPLVHRVLVVDKGRIVMDGPRDQVLERLRDAQTAARGAASARAVQPAAGAGQASAGAAA